jgi:hypothetical protein
MARSIVEISGHIIDFELLNIQIGHRRTDRSHARVEVEASSEELLAEVLAKIREHGALPVERKPRTRLGSMRRRRTEFFPRHFTLRPICQLGPGQWAIQNPPPDS